MNAQEKDWVSDGRRLCAICRERIPFEEIYGHRLMEHIPQGTIDGMLLRFPYIRDSDLLYLCWKHILTVNHRNGSCCR